MLLIVIMGWRQRAILILDPC